MASPRTQLNDVTIRSLPAPVAGQAQYPDGKLSGFGVRVTATGLKTFYLTYRENGASRRLTLGRYPALSLADARKKAHEALAKIARDETPVTRTQAAIISQDSFAARLDQFVETHCKRRNRASTANETERLLRRNFLTHWRSRQIATIKKSDVIGVLDKIVADGTPSAANHAFAAVRKFFNWCVERGVLETSPCLGIKAPARAQSRDRVLSDDEIAGLWHASNNQGYPFGPIFQLLALTAQRRGEVVGMQWEELDLDARVWTIPGARTKNGKTHTVPLSPMVVSIIQSLPRFSSDYVFPARGKLDRPYSGYSKGKRALDAAAGLHDWTLHDLRRTAATGMAKQGTPPHVVERILNHTSGTFGGVAGVYNRFSYLDEMRAALLRWSKPFSVTSE